ncbi:TIR domain-containing protein [uncultured Croceitalea sp.]|uniref:TIR domain-containing protein n=1 Tax=uncultured Croceitalea sp. TaxID=1798908 RepID=UPI0033061949
MSNSARNIFVSHFNKDEDKIQNLKDLVKNKEGVSLKNYSIDGSKPNDAKNEEYVKSLLREGIKAAGTLVVLIGNKTHERWWVDWEIEQAHKLGKRIVGVYLHGASESDVPENFDKYGDSLVGWQAEKVIDSIDGKINNMEKPDGNPRDTKWRNESGEC